MSRTEEMEQNHPDLDRELAALAAEVPEIPADFHHGWVDGKRRHSRRRRLPGEWPASGGGWPGWRP